MTTAMIRVLMMVILVCMTGCANGYQKFYHSYIEPETLQDVKFLAEGEVPKVYGTDDPKRDAKIAKSKGYIALGYSAFNGPMASQQDLISQATSLRATMVLTRSKFAGTRTDTVPLFLPNNKTTYSSGTVTGAYGNANYSGSSTSYGTTVVPITTEQHRYEQSALYLVKSTKKPRYGIFYIDLTPELRSSLERNTGVLIDTIIEDSPAFFANILPGDVLIEMNGTIINNVTFANEFLRTYKGDTAVFKIMRNGIEKVIEFKIQPI